MKMNAKTRVVSAGRWFVMSAVVGGAIGAICLLGTTGWSRPTPLDHVTYTGSKSTSKPGFTIYSGGGSIQQGSTGVMFGPIIQGESNDRMRYVTLVKYSPGQMSLNGMHLSMNSDGFHADAKTELTINGKPVSFTYKVTGDRNSRKIASEALMFNGKPVSLNKGALLLLDLRSPSATLHQVQAPLPPIPYEDTPERVDVRAQQVLDILKKQSPVVREFVQ